jgi:hypothetical protein
MPIGPPLADHELVTSRVVVSVAALAVAGSALTSCGTHGGSITASEPTKRCLSLWNRDSNPKLAATILYNDVAGTPAGLLETKRHGRCEVALGAVDSSYLDNVFIFYPAEGAYVEDRTLEGAGRATKLPPWNAKLHEDGTLTLERP